MRDLALRRYRNIGIMAHIDAGKTTVSERILVFTGRIHRAGNIDDGNTTLDWLVDERKRGITITAAATTAWWEPLTGSLKGQKHRINLIDTPGHVDFTIEVERSLRVLDGAVAVFDAGNGVEPQSETVWRQADRYHVPRLAFINKMDKVGADFEMCVTSLRERLGARAIPVQLPVGEGATHVGVIDLLRMQAYVFDKDVEGREFSTVPVPDELRAKALAARAALVEACADFDEEVMRKFLDGKSAEVSELELERALRKGTLSLSLVPVLCGAAYRNKGVQMLLDGVCSYLPSPEEMPAVIGKRVGSEETIRFEARDDGPFCALVFKLMHLEQRTIVFLRVYSGTAETGDAVRCVRTGEKQALRTLALLHANKLERISEARAGMIVAADGLDDVRTGDTLVELKGKGELVALESMQFPEPVLELAVHPKTRLDHDRMGEALRKLALEDPSFRVATDVESGELRIQGMGELHLDVLVSRLKEEHKVEVSTGQPAVSYRETLVRPAEAEHMHRMQNGGVGQYAKVKLSVRPLESGAGFRFVDAVRGGVIPREFLPAIKKGVQGAMERGLLASYPVVDVEVTVLDGDFHETDSDTRSFEIAGSMAFQKAAQAAGMQLLEPVMAVEVVVPEEHLGAVMGDLQSRRGQVLGLGQRGNGRVVDGEAPLDRLFGYVSQLRGLCHGRVTTTMRFARYASVPKAVEQQVVSREHGTHA